MDKDTNGTPSYEVEALLAQRGKGVRRELLVRWLGYGAEHDERSELTRSAPLLVAEYDALQQVGVIPLAAQVLLSSLKSASVISPQVAA
jgi:hypothetical protein